MYRISQIGRLFAPVLGAFLLISLPAANAQAPEASSNSAGNAGGGLRYIEAGQPPVMIHPTLETAQFARQQAARGGHGPGGGGGGTVSNNLYYHGGVGGVGVETSPKIYLVFWGSQWTGNDPSGEGQILQNFFSVIGGSAWLNSVTQYCQGVATNTIFCNGGGNPAGNQAGILAGVWSDSSSAAPSKPRQSQLAAEAVRAAAHFGNTTAATNASVQYVIATASGNNASGFGTQYCAWHSSTSSSTVGTVAYTNLPYITDAGASCGANFNGLGPNAGITIVEGHEMGETITDQFPNGGWLDANGAENGDKCAWISSGQGASANISVSNYTFPVQSLWSNAYNSGKGGCVLSY